LVRPDGRVFAWRGITAFRLLEMEAGGRGHEAEAYLRWAASQRLTVVRVLVMAKHLFVLEPERGVKALDALLTRAARHGLFVEVVALADTAEYPIDIPAHVKRVGEICARHANAVIEIANEPYHGTQRAEVHDPGYLARLRTEIPATVPTALGAGNYPAVIGAGDFVTVHYPRSVSHAGWGWVAGLKDASAHVRQTRKPVIDNEPIGAGERMEPGRRDPSPERFRAAAIAGRLMGIGATFHYEAGLQAQRPAGNSLACFRAWQEGLTLVAGDGGVEPFEAGPSAPVRGIRGDHAAAFLGRRGDTAWVLIIGAGTGVVVDWQSGWTVITRREWPASRFYAVRRGTAGSSGRK
jgi:hypothetical protein